jgi:hypothetical protein
MRARTIAALVVAGVALLVVGTMAGRGQDPERVRAVPSREAAGATTRALPATDPPPATARPRGPASTSSTAAPFAQGRQGTDRLEREEPLARALPHHTPHYAIDYRMVDGRLEVTVRLYAVLNDADQLAEYEGQLRRYKGEALDFIRARGEDPGAYRIVYQPPEAAPL